MLLEMKSDMEKNKEREYTFGSEQNHMDALAMIMGMFASPNESREYVDKMLEQLGLPKIDAEDVLEYGQCVSDGANLKVIQKFLAMSDEEYYVVYEYLPGVAHALHDVKEVILPVIEERVNVCEAKEKEFFDKYKMKKGHETVDD